MDRDGDIDPDELRLLATTLGSDSLAQIMRLVDQKRVIEVRSEVLGRTLYSVQSSSYDILRKQQGQKKWLEQHKKRLRREKRRKLQNEERLDQFKHIEILDGTKAAQEWAKKQKAKEDAEWRERYRLAQEEKRMKLERQREREARRLKKRKIWKFQIIPGIPLILYFLTSFCGLTSSPLCL